jgi:hypothetical protein
MSIHRAGLSCWIDPRAGSLVPHDHCYLFTFPCHGVSNEWMTVNSKGSEKKLSPPNLGHSASICLEVLRKTMKPLGQGNRCSGRDSNRPPSEYGSRDSIVVIAPGYRLDDRGVGVRVLIGTRILSSPRQDLFWAPPSLLSNGYRG